MTFKGFGRPPFSRAALLLALAGGSFAGCISERPDPAGPGEGSEVRIENFQYLPPDLTVPVGTPVVWTNEDDVVHTVTAQDGSFDSSTFGNGQTFRFVTASVGNVSYICSVHPFMQAVLRVTTASPP